MPTPFHFAFNVLDLDATREFYSGVMGAVEGRSTDTWVDFDFFGHQLSMHLGEPMKTAATGRVGDHMVPMPHFGIVLPLDQWTELAGRMEDAQTDFVIAPSARFRGEPGEQWTMFVRDPSGNPIEVKSFANMDGVFDS